MIVTSALNYTEFLYTQYDVRNVNKWFDILVMLAERMLVTSW